FVVQAGCAGGEKRAAAYDELPDRGALRIREPAHIWQDQERELARFTIEIVGVDRQIWDAGPDERVHEAGVRRIHAVGRFIAAEEIGISLRPQDTDRGDRLAIDQKRLVF